MPRAGRQGGNAHPGEEVGGQAAQHEIWSQLRLQGNVLCRIQPHAGRVAAHLVELPLVVIVFPRFEERARTRLSRISSASRFLDHGAVGAPDRATGYVE
jgi:hypothetical protein